MPEFQGQVANIAKHGCLMETIWNLVPQLSREPFELKEKSKLNECAPR